MKVEIKKGMQGSVVYVDGFEIPDITNVGFRHKAGEIAKVSIDILAFNEFNIEVDAEVQITIVAMPGWSITTKRSEDGSTRHVCAELPGD